VKLHSFVKFNTYLHRLETQELILLLLLISGVQANIIAITVHVDHSLKHDLV